MRVVATLPDYAFFAKEIGGDLVQVHHIVEGNQDAHFIRPKPSFVARVANADLLIATGLDLELWLPTVVDRSGNRKVRSGEPGYVAASQGMKLLEVPEVMSRITGGVHVYGNPHVTCSPVNMRIAAANIATGLCKIDPTHQKYYESRLKKLIHRIDTALFGKELVDLLGGDTLCQLAENGRLFQFLESRKAGDRKLDELLGGWMARARPLRGLRIVTYHKNWVYFLRLFGLREAGTVEPRPGIPPSPRHRVELLQMMKRDGVKIVFAANYFNRSLARDIAERVGGKAVIVPLYVGGAEGVDDYFELVDYWLDGLLKAAKELGLTEEGGGGSK